MTVFRAVVTKCRWRPGVRNGIVGRLERRLGQDHPSAAAQLALELERIDFASASGEAVQAVPERVQRVAGQLARDVGADLLGHGDSLETMQNVVSTPTVCIVNVKLTVARLVATAPLGTIRTSDLAEVYAHPRGEARALERRGLLHRLGHGFYCAVPAEHDPALWQPTIEAAAAGIATAIYGDRVPVLTGLTAARVQRALPRAIDVAFVAVPTQRRPLQLLDRAGQVRFVTRAVTDLDAVLVTTDLGQVLATTPEQTVLDLGRADPHGLDVDAREVIDALWAECDQAVLADIAGRQRMQATFKRLRAGR